MVRCNSTNFAIGFSFPCSLGVPTAMVLRPGHSFTTLMKGGPELPKRANGVTAPFRSSHTSAHGGGRSTGEAGTYTRYNHKHNFSVRSDMCRRQQTIPGDTRRQCGQHLRQTDLVSSRGSQEREEGGGGGWVGRRWRTPKVRKNGQDNVVRGLGLRFCGERLKGGIKSKRCCWRLAQQFGGKLWLVPNGCSAVGVQEGAVGGWPWTWRGPVEIPVVP